MHHTLPRSTLPRSTLPRSTLPHINAPLSSPLLLLQALGKFDDKVKEHLLDPAVEDEIQLYSTGTFERELGLTDGGDDGDGGGAGDFNFGKKDELWGAWNKVVEKEDVEGTKRLGKYIQLTGDPVRFMADFGSPVGIKPKLNSLLGHGMHSALYPLISFDAPSWFRLFGRR